MGDADIIIRDANSRDAETIAKLVARLADSTGQTDKQSSTAADFERHGFGARPAFRALIAEQAGKAVGLALWFYNFSSWRGDLGVYLQDIYVDSRLRGSGLGRRLLAETARLALQDGASHLRLSVASSNKAAQDFYRHLGFTAREDERIYQIADLAFTGLADCSTRRDPGK